MKKYLFFTLFFFYLSSKIITEKFNYEITEEIDGLKFIQSENSINSKSLFSYKVDTQDVNKEDFEKAKLKAKKRELSNKFKKEQESRQKRMEENHNLKISLNKKILKTDLEWCNAKVQKIKKSKLVDYFVYNSKSFNSEQEWQKFIDFVLPELDKILQKSNEELEVVKLEHFIEKLEPYKEKINQLMQDSINNAIEKCDDTKKLKKIMILID